MGLLKGIDSGESTGVLIGWEEGLEIRWDSNLFSVGCGEIVHVPVLNWVSSRTWYVLLLNC